MAGLKIPTYDGPVVTTLNTPWASPEELKDNLNALWYGTHNDDYGIGTVNRASLSSGDLRGRDTQVALQQAAAENALSAQKQSAESARASASAGVNKPRAGMLADNSTQQNQTNNVPQLYGMAKNQTQTTSNDYLQKMAQADALDQQASNIQKGAALTAFGGAIQGGASGAMTGATLGMGSDENMKESPQTNKVTDEELNKAIRQFRELYRRVRKCQHR